MFDLNKGLSSKKALELLEIHGPNRLPEKSPPSDIKIFFSQFKSPLVYILFVAGAVTFFLREYSDTVIILAAVLLNSILGFFQERKANNALEALKKLVHPQATVIRDGERSVIPFEDIVPGDLCIVNSGDKIPADGELFEAKLLFVDEALLTGESVPVGKEMQDEVFMGTVVSGGRGIFWVTKTGAKTSMGKIAHSVQEVFEDTPLRQQLAAFSRQLTYLVVFLVGFVFVIGLFSDKGIEEIFTTSVALSVSSIPEGLLVGLTVVLALGMQRILKRKGLVRNLVSAETLGGVTTICTDKTGTLTKGQMKVVKTEGLESDLAVQSLIANDLDDPVVIAAYDWAKSKSAESAETLLKKHKRYDDIPFSSENKFFASLNKWDAKNTMMFVNGAPEYLLKWSDLTEKEREQIEKLVDDYSKNGMRVIGMARKKLPLKKRKLLQKDVKSDLTWVGLLAFSDPPRKGVGKALKKAQKAGVSIMVITGDYAQTAKSVLHELGISVAPEDVILGSELEHLSEKDLAQRLDGSTSVKLFARTTPDQKLAIVEALKLKGEVVAMTGDGVNDAPALNRADIGIVVGEATEVAKESADLVLMDSSFDTIVAAIEEGRGLYDNLRKIILYLMSDAFEGIFTVTGTLIVSIFIPVPLPVTAAQILWINLVSDGFPHLALTFDAKSKDIMSSPPRSPKEQLVAGWMKSLILTVSSIGGVMALSIFLYTYFTTYDTVLARSVAFATLGVNSSMYVYSVRRLTNSFWKEPIFDNKWLNMAVIASFVIQFAPFVIPGLRTFLGVTSLSLAQYAMVFGASTIMFISIEISKVVFRRRLAVN